MAFPSPPSFADGNDGAVWWRVRAGGQIYVCSTSAFTFIALLQQKVGATPDGAWGPDTQRRLVSALQANGAPGVLVAGVQADANAHRAGLASYGAAIWLLHRQSFDQVPTAVPAPDIVVPSDTTLPRWSTRPPVTGVPSTGVTCRAQNVETAPGPPAPPPPPDSTQQTPPTNAPSTGGSAPSTGGGVQIDLPTGVAAPGQQLANPAVTWGLIAVGVGLVGVFFLTELGIRKERSREGKGRR